jgi:hypothetical protein
MELNKKQTEFWAVILIICLVVSAAIMLVDFQIKQAILEESVRLRLAIEEWEVRSSGLRANKNRATNDSTDNATISGSVLVDQPARMETGNVSNGATKQAPKTTARRQPKSQGKTDN